MAGRLQRSVPALLAFVLVVWSGAAFAGGNAAAYSPAALNPTYMQTMGGPGHAQMYPSGDAVAPNGDLVVADTGNDQVARYTSSGALVWRGGSPGTAVGQYFQPRDVAVDAEGEVFVADDGNHRVVKLAADGTPLQTWGQSGDPYLSSPIGISVVSEDVYVADAGSQQVDEFNTTGGLIRTFTTQGACALGRVRDATADSNGNVYVANYLNNDIVKLSPTGACLATFGTPGTGPGQFANPYGVDVGWDPIIGAQAVYVADSNNDRVQEFRTDGTFVTVIGGPGAADGQFLGLRRVAAATDGSGDVWAADMWGYRVEHFHRTATGYSFVATFGGVPPPLTSTQTYNQPHSVDLDGSGNLYVQDTVNQRVVQTRPDGSIIRACGQRGFGQAGEFNWPRGVAVDRTSGNIWIADTKQNDVQVMQANCTPVARIQNANNPLETFSSPSSLTYRSTDGTVWLADAGNNRIISFDAATEQPIASFGSRGAGTGDFNNPSSVAVDPVSGRIVVADTGNNRIVELNDSGSGFASYYSTVSCAGVRPNAIAVDPADRLVVLAGSRLYVCDQNGNLLATVKSWSTTNGTDSFDQPAGLSIDGQGDVFVADTLHDRIVEFSIGSVSVSPPSGPAGLTTNLHGQGFRHGEGVHVTVDGRPWLSLVADPTGAVSVTQANLPSLPPGTYVVTAAGLLSGIVARCTVTINPAGAATTHR